jgi:hypothetical protein
MIWEFVLTAIASAAPFFAALLFERRAHREAQVRSYAHAAQVDHLERCLGIEADRRHALERLVLDAPGPRVRPAPARGYRDSASSHRCEDVDQRMRELAAEVIEKDDRLRDFTAEVIEKDEKIASLRLQLSSAWTQFHRKNEELRRAKDPVVDGYIRLGDEAYTRGPK